MIHAPLRRLLVPAGLALAGCGGHPKSAAAPLPPPNVHPVAPVTAATLLPAVRVNGTLLRYRLAGDTGTPVVFVHGSMAGLDEWSAQLEAFRHTHRVLVYSRRYHAPNPAVDDREVYSPALHAADLAALLQALDLAPAHVVGASYGAYTALVLALEHPEMVRSLVLGEPPVVPLLLRTPAGDSLRRTFEATTLDPARAAFTRGDSVEGLRRFLDGLSGSPGRFDHLSPPARAALLAQAFEVRRELRADWRLYLPPVACAGMGRVATPVLLLQGQRSPRMFHVITEELARCFRSDTLATVPGAGYGIHVVNPAYYNQIVLQYIATH